MSDLRRQFRESILEILNRSDTPSVFECEVILYRAAKLRELLLTNSLKQRGQSVIEAGPFEGMRYHDFTVEGTHLPKITGAYEHPLHEIIEASVARNYATIFNIGAADGYYGVGMARRCPESRVILYEEVEERREQCRTLAAMNDVSERCEIRGRFTPGELESLAALGDGLILCDIEGAEKDLLDPSTCPALARFDIVVECHDLLAKPGETVISTLLAERFEATHKVRLVPHDSYPGTTVPDWARGLSQLDQLLCLWEERAGPTPWLYMTARNS